MNELFAFSDDDKLRELNRELLMRKSVYPNQVARNKMSQMKADRQIAVLEAIIKDYQDARFPTKGDSNGS